MSPLKAFMYLICVVCGHTVDFRPSPAPTTLSPTPSPTTLNPTPFIQDKQFKFGLDNCTCLCNC